MQAIQKSHRSYRRKSDIIKAALTCFNELGYAETTMALIRKEAQASTGSIYHHFQSKDQLAAAVYLEGILDYQKGYVRALEKQTDAKKGIMAIIRYHLGWVERNPEWARYLNTMRHARFMNQTEDAFKLANRDFMTRIGRWFAPHVKAKRIKRLPQEVFSALLMGSIQEYTRMWLAGHTNLKPGEAAKHMAKAALENLTT